MTTRERIARAVRGERVDRVPMTVYPGLFPRGETERRLRNEGVGFHHRVGVCAVAHPNVRTRTEAYQESGQDRIRDTLITPVGEVWQTWKTGTALGGRVRTDFYVKQPEDYHVLEFLYRDAVYSPAYDGILQAREIVGDDGYVSGNLGYSPMQEMIVNLMGIEQFSIEWHERRDALLSLYRVMAERHRETFAIAAEAPVDLVIYGDNVTSDIIGKERFETYCVPMYDGLAEAMHAKGKLAGSHLDGMLKALREPLAKCKLDVIEAFACAPDGDVTLGEARQWWPDKVFWINYPSSVHLLPPEDIEAETRRLLEDAAPGDRLIVGVTEDMPSHCWQQSATAISAALLKYGGLPMMI